MKYNLLCVDPPWSFSDQLRMDKVKRGAAANYKLLDNNIIKNLNIKEIVADDSVLALWVPSSLLEVGLECLKNYGFDHKQTVIWVKTKKDPFAKLKKDLRTKATKKLVSLSDISKSLEDFDLDSMCQFFMGRIFRQCHEVVLIGTRGKANKLVKNHSQRSVIFDTNLKHSSKPEELQDRLETIFPAGNNCELFARRVRANFTCCGLECPNESLGEDIRDSIERLKKL